MTADGYSFFLSSSGEISTRFHVSGRLPLASMWAGFNLIGFCDAREVSAFIREWKRARRPVRATDASARTKAFARLALLAQQREAAERLRAAESPTGEGAR